MVEERRKYLTPIPSLVLNLEKYVVGRAVIDTKSGKFNTDPFTVIIAKQSADAVEQKKTTVQAQLSDTTIYLGQQMILQLKLMTQENIKSYDVVNKMEFDGFFVRELGRSSRRSERIISEGEEFFHTVLESIALFPQQTGTYTIPSISVKLGVPKASRRRSLFSFQEYNYKIFNTEPVEVKVAELPRGAPISFSGAVGKYRASFGIDKRTLSTDQTLTLKMEIRGNGDNKNTIPPILDIDDNFEVYDPNTLRDESFTENGKILDYKSYEYLIVPKENGRYSINPSFSYFDTESNEYRTIYPPRAFTINVTKGSATTTDISSITNRNLLPYKPISKLHTPASGFMGSIPFLSILALMGLGIIGMIGHQWILKKQKSIDPLTKAQRKARKVADKRLALAQSFLEANNEREFYNELTKTIINYLEDKLIISTGSLSKENLIELLTSKDVPQNTIDKVSVLLSKSELALFAGSSAGMMPEMYEQSATIIEDMEGVGRLIILK